MTPKITRFAPAKINLTLHVTGQRSDGFHLLDSLVVFANIGDEITVSAAQDLSLSVDGPMAQGVPTDQSNLVLKAAQLLGAEKTAQIHLTKNLPPASGIGGGSSDAAATLRALSQLWEMPLPDPQSTLGLGADLPVCLTPIPQRMRGIGERLMAVPNLPACDILLVNPRVEVATPAIFKNLKRKDNPTMPAQLPKWQSASDLAIWLKTQRNDLQDQAIAQQPIIADVLAALDASDSLCARMSGSGATCFALFPANSPATQAAQARISSDFPDWWSASGQLLT